MTIENPFIRTLLATALLSAGLTVLSAPAAAQSAKSVEIGIPGNPSAPPTVVPPALVVTPGEEIEFKRNGSGNVFVVFTNPGKTPFVDNRGDPVYSFPVVQMGARFKIRNDTNPCNETAPGQSDCKYMIVDLRDTRRPPLDPYIIIR
ncbi:MAG: hypothetical protein R6V61_01465 [Wenzhouxiangellaceae bacterium]